MHGFSWQHLACCRPSWIGEDNPGRVLRPLMEGFHGRVLRAILARGPMISPRSKAFIIYNLLSCPFSARLPDHCTAFSLKQLQLGPCEARRFPEARAWVKYVCYAHQYFPRICFPSCSFFLLGGSSLFSTNQATHVIFCWGPSSSQE